MTLISRLSTLHARLLTTPRRLGVPEYQHTVEVISTTIPDGEFLPVETVTRIEPNPKVSTVNGNPRLEGLIVGETIVIRSDDLTIDDINGTYTEEQLKVNEWTIDGIKHTLLRLSRKATSWSAIVRRGYD